MASVLFYRRYLGLTGGHLKVWDYFNHVRHSGRYKPFIRFSPDTVWDEDNPWRAYRWQLVNPFRLYRPNVRFLAGKDWLFLRPSLREKPQAPVINLIQGVRHADPGLELRAFLRHRAVRICVSAPVADAIRNTGEANGPVITIPECLDVSAIKTMAAGREKKTAVLINAVKRQDLGVELGRALGADGINVQVHTTPVPRKEFLRLLSAARIVVCLPLAAEGFYLPAFEAMAAGAIVICPDCEGNRDYCRPGVNCVVPPYTVPEILAAVRDALAWPPEKSGAVLEQAACTVSARDLAKERNSFLEVLENLPDLWRESWPASA